MSEPASDFADPGCLARLRAGHADAFEAVVKHYERPLRAWLATRTPPGVDGDEVAQKSFIAAYTRIGEFEDGSNFAGWLFAIAKWQLQTEVTRLRRVADYHTRYAPDLLQLELQRQWETPPDLLTTRLDHLRQCMQQLGESLSQFLHWRYHDEMPLEEMARLSGRSVAAVGAKQGRPGHGDDQCAKGDWALSVFGGLRPTRLRISKVGAAWLSV